MKKKKIKANTKSTHQHRSFKARWLDVNSTGLELALEEPDRIKEIIELCKTHADGSPLKYFLDIVRREVCSFLERANYPTDLNELWWIRESVFYSHHDADIPENADPYDHEIESAIEALFAINALEEKCGNQIAEDVFFDALRLIAALVRIDTYDAILEGKYTRMFKKKGPPAKFSEVIFAWVITELRKNPEITGGKLLIKLEKPLSVEYRGERYEIYLDGDKIFQECEDGTVKKISKNHLKNYFTRAKCELGL
jgi:hypothetical protein